MTPPSAASVISLLGGAHELAGEALTARSPAALGRSRDRARVARAHARAAADEAAEVRGLGQRALGARRGDLERVALAQVGQRSVTRSHSCERDAVGVVDEHAQRAAAEHLGEQHLDVGLARREPLLDICLYGVSSNLLLYAKKAGVRPLSVLLPASARRHESCRSSIASGRMRAGHLSPAGRACDALRRVRVAPGAVAIDAVVLALRAQRAGQRERLAGLAVAPQQLHRAAQAEQRVVVGRRVRGDRLELLGRALVALRVKQRAARAPRGSRPCRARGRALCSAARSPPGGRRARAARSRAGRGRRRCPSTAASC